ncbi:MAG: sigma-70 family RNA polymerase sigma factor [Polyangiales bacterium]
MSVTVEVSAPAPTPDERELCRRLAPAVRAFAQRRLRGAAAEDFAQDVLLTLVGALRAGRIEDVSKAGAFALGICRHLAADRARSRDRRRELMERYGVTELPVEGAWEEPAVLPRDHLEDCVSQLGAKARAVLRATFYDDDGDAEIAAGLGVTAQNVRVIRHRALATLRECMDRPISWSVR